MPKDPASIFWPPHRNSKNDPRPRPHSLVEMPLNQIKYSHLLLSTRYELFNDMTSQEPATTDDEI